MKITSRISPSQIMNVRSALKRFKSQTEQETKAMVQAAGLVAESRAAEAAPVDTGRLWQSIRKRSEFRGLHARVFTNVKYARYQNDGTSTIPGKRFMEKGYAAAKQYLIRRINTEKIMAERGLIREQKRSQQR